MNNRELKINNTSYNHIKGNRIPDMAGGLMYYMVNKVLSYRKKSTEKMDRGVIDGFVEKSCPILWGKNVLPKI